MADYDQQDIGLWLDAKTRTLSQAIASEGYTAEVFAPPEDVPGGLGERLPHAGARVFERGGQVGVAILEDSWDYAYAASHEIAEHRHGFLHSAEVFREQSNILARWLKAMAGRQR